MLIAFIFLIISSYYADFKNNYSPYNNKISLKLYSILIILGTLIGVTFSFPPGSSITYDNTLLKTGNAKLYVSNATIAYTYYRKISYVVIVETIDSSWLGYSGFSGIDQQIRHRSYGYGQAFDMQLKPSEYPASTTLIFKYLNFEQSGVTSIRANYIIIAPQLQSQWIVLTQKNDIGSHGVNFTTLNQATNEQYQTPPFSIMSFQSGVTYRNFIMFKGTQLTTTDTSNYQLTFNIQLKQLGVNSYSYLFTGKNAYVQFFWITLILFPQQTLSQTRVQLYQVNWIVSGGNVFHRLLQNLEFDITSENCLVGLMGVNSVGSHFFEIYPVNNILQLEISGTTKMINLEVILIYKMECEIYFYYSNTTGQCQTCIDYCTVCDNGLTCSVCATNFYLNAGDTECQCPDEIVSGICYDFYNSRMRGCIAAVYDSTTVKCQTCNSSLNLVASSIKDKCQCVTGYTKINPSDILCSLSCNPSQYYDLGSDSCQQCFQYCSICDNVLTCLTCQTNFDLNSLNTECQCFDEIVSGICYDFFNSPMRGCISAQKNQILECLTCSDSDNLIVSDDNLACQCKDGFERIDPDVTKCLIECDEHYYYSENSQQCQSCNDYCLECNNGTICTTCYTTFTLNGDGTLCQCSDSIITDVCYDFQTSPLKGCTAAFYDEISSSVKCTICSDPDNLIISGDNTECLCKTGYQKINPSDIHCQLNCGQSKYFTFDTNQCESCIDYCIECDDGTTCSTCDTGFVLNSGSTECQCSDEIVSGICYDFFNSPIRGCIMAFYSSTNVKCTLCSNSDNLIASSDKTECECKTSYQRLDQDSVNCEKILDCDPYFYFSRIARACTRCINNCIDCIDGTTCQTCKTNFLPNADNTKCECTLTLLSGICYDFYNSPIRGCISAYNDLGTVKCRTCSNSDNLLVSANNDECSCLYGYERTDSTETKCLQICGDSILVKAQCDDGNTKSYDGCSSKCELEDGFKCDNSVPVNCKSQISLVFKIDSMVKNDRNNSVLYTISTFRQIIPFDLTFEELDFDGSHQVYIYDESDNGNTTDFLQDSYLMSVSGNTLEVLVNYQFTIEGLETLITINMTQTRYSMSQANIQFTSKGSNEALKYSTMIEQFQQIGEGLAIINILSLLILSIGLVAPKFIGLELNITLQSIFYSQMLIHNMETWPTGFMFLEYLRNSIGYNDIIQVTQFIPQDIQSWKYFNLQIKKAIIQNFNTSFLILLIATIIFMMSLILRKHREGKVRQLKYLEQVVKDQTQMLRQQQKLNFLVIVNEKTFYIWNQLSYWCILQIMSALAVAMNLDNSYVIQLQQQIKFGYFTLGCLIFILASVIVICVGVNFFFNFCLHMQTIVRFNERPHQLEYKKFTFLYLLILGFLIFFWHSTPIFTIPCSAYVLAVHLIYTVFILVRKPYQLSLKMHKAGLIINQIVYLIFLLYVNTLNFYGELYEFFGLCLGYLLIACCIFLILLSFVRFYYEFRYGRQLEIKLQKQKEQKERLKKIQEDNEVQRYRDFFRNNPEDQKKIQYEQKLAKNPFVYQNNIIEEQRIRHWNWVQSRQFWEYKKKQKQYYKQFDRKPMQWLKQNDINQYNKIIAEEQTGNAERARKKKQQDQDPELQEIKKKLRQDLKRKKIANGQLIIKKQSKK